MHPPRPDDHHGERIPRAGDRIAGKYVVERVLKRGGMGVVLAARHAELAQPVAIKVLLPELADDAGMVARFLREGRAVSALRSDHVVRVHDVGRLEGGTPYLVMEMLHGSDLDRRVRKGGPLPWQEAVGYVMQVCEALVEAHAIGIVHRDLKPSNLFLVELPSGVSTVKVLDFGISKAGGLDAPLNDAHGITTTEAVLGSPTFMAPEQLKSAKYVDARADIWSLGLVLHFLVTGKLAFDAETLGAYLLKILQEPAIPVRSLRPDVPPELEAIILRCLEKEPALRFPTAVDLRAALAPFAPFAAHVSGMYAAARLAGTPPTGLPLPHSMGLSPSAPTPVGGVPAASMRASVPSSSSFTPAPYAGLPPHLGGPTPAGGLFSPHTPPGGLAALSTPSGGLSPSAPTPGGAFPSFPSSPGLVGPTSDAPSAPPPFGSANTQASWTSAGRRLRPSGLRWAVVTGVALVGGLVTVLLWPTDPPAGPAAQPTAPATAQAPPSASTPPPAITPSGAMSTAATSTLTASASASAAPGPSAPAGATTPPSGAPAGPVAGGGAPPATAGTSRPKTPATAPTKRISGPMETDL